VQANGRDSINYSTFTERRSVVSKEQIMALPNLHGYWKYGDAVVPFRIEPKDRPKVAKSFIQRPPKPVIQKELKQQTLRITAPSGGNGDHATEITTEMIDDVDTEF
jgi:hypothetical protein